MKHLGIYAKKNDMGVFLFICLTTCCLSVSSAFTEAANNQKKPTLTIAYVEFAPYTYTDQNGNPRGLLIEKAAETLRKAELGWNAVSYPAGRLFKAIASGEAHLFLGIKTIKEFEGKTVSSNAKIADIELRIYYNKCTSRINKPEDLKKDSTLIFMSGYPYERWGRHVRDPENRVRVIIVNNREDALKKLKNREADYFLDYKETVDEALKKFGSYSELRFNRIIVLPCYFVLSNKVKDAPKVINKIDSSYKVLYK